MHDASLPAGAAELMPGSDASGDMTRRRFTTLGMSAVGACYAAALGYPIYRYLNTPARRAARVRCFVIAATARLRASCTCRASNARRRLIWSSAARRHGN